MGCCWSSASDREYLDLSDDISVHVHKPPSDVDVKGLEKAMTATSTGSLQPSPRVTEIPTLVGCWREKQNGMAIKFNKDRTFETYQLLSGDGEYIIQASNSSQFRIIFKGDEPFTATCQFSGNTLRFNINNEAAIFDRWEDDERATELAKELQKVLDSTTDSFLEKEILSLEKRYLLTLDDLKSFNNKGYSDLVGKSISRIATFSPKASIIQRTRVIDQKRNLLESESHLDNTLVGTWLMPFFPRGPPEVNAMVFERDGSIELPMPGVKRKERGNFITNEKKSPCQIDCLFKDQDEWDYGIYQLKDEGAVLDLELGERGTRKRPANFGRRKITAKRVRPGDTIEFLKAVEALLEPLKTILRKESVDPTVIGSFLKTAEKLTIEEDNTNLAKMQEIFSKIRVSEQFHELERLYHITLNDCKHSSDPNTKRTLENIISSLKSM